MLVADGVGIMVGVVLCRRIPQRKIKWFSAIIFVLFGLVGVYEVLSVKVGLGITSLVLAVLATITGYAMYAISKRQKTVEDPKICKNPPF
jgi:predicted membrane channel-forming protein YqfA (hemolysin III family)